MPTPEPPSGRSRMRGKPNSELAPAARLRRGRRHNRPPGRRGIRLGSAAGAGPAPSAYAGTSRRPQRRPAAASAGRLSTGRRCRLPHQRSTGAAQCRRPVADRQRAGARGGPGPDPQRSRRRCRRLRRLAQRHAGDLDLLVPKAHVPACLPLLRELGYRPLQEIPNDRVLEALFRSWHHLNFVREDGLVAIELHWRLSAPRHPTAIAPDETVAATHPCASG